MKPDWTPTADDVLRDARTAYDEMRERCPIAYSELMHWSLFRHEDVSRVLHDHASFSNAVSAHVSVPHGIDPPEHGAYRRIIDPYFAPERMTAFEPICKEIVVELVQAALVRGEVEMMADVALPFAVRVQCAFLGWPGSLHESLIRWTRKNHAATLSRDSRMLAEVAREFDDFIDAQLDARAAAGGEPAADVTAELLRERIHDRALSREEITSILRNWTAGEIGTISAAVGILAHYLAQHSGLQERLRAQPDLLPASIDEILRIHGPLVANRRVTTRAVDIGGRSIGAGERISLIWISANRDGRVFPDPDAFRLDRDASANLLYGAGIHVCPGAPLARMELRLFMEELLRRTQIELVAGMEPVNATYPAGGFSSVPLSIRAAR
ncbi:MAG: cytochrome P450 [Burkholderiales bacterium]|nr:cytochrome P450 [Burkholderiales bacterium]